MYGFQPSDDQRTLIEAVHRFAVRELRPHLRTADEAGALPESTTRSGWELGLLPATLPEAFGGFGERSVVTGASAPGSPSPSVSSVRAPPRLMARLVA